VKKIRVIRVDKSFKLVVKVLGGELCWLCELCVLTREEGGMYKQKIISVFSVVKSFGKSGGI
jgi:hypothetical protein